MVIKQQQLESVAKNILTLLEKASSSNQKALSKAILLTPTGVFNALQQAGILKRELLNGEEIFTFSPNLMIKTDGSIVSSSQTTKHEFDELEAILQATSGNFRKLNILTQIFE